MRFEFPHSAREDFHWEQRRLNVGSGVGSDLVLPAGQVAPEHVSIDQDSRGWVLGVVRGAGRIYVNARPVRERALLRPGDMLGIGDCRLLLRADQDPQARQPLPRDELRPCPVALRAVSGALSGQVFPMREKLEVGAGAAVPLELPQEEQAGFCIRWEQGQLRLVQTLGSTRYPLRLNGALVSDAALRSDDQIGLGMHRFLLDAPGLELEPPVRMPRSSSEALPEDAAGPRGEAWWLILTAALLALGIALMLLVRF